ncbi:MAG TPA: cytochrome c oxidase assembly protein [Candidatus Dormibacteraeota bacterium]|nr:cytochrome c oxidase assembly protein [Candidatus Dormibacteraeota bacterium]
MAVSLGIILAVIYFLGGRRPVRLLGAAPRWNARQWRTTAFFAGLVMLMLGTSTPVDALTRQSLSARTAQLMALLMVVAPLLVIGAPHPRFLRLIRNGRSDNRSLSWVPAAAFVLFNGAVILSFLPPIYQATARSGWAGQLFLLAMVGLAYMFWSQVIDQPPGRCRLSHLGRAVYLLLSSAQLRILGIVLGFASASFYPVPLVDQQVAAGIVMVPGVLTDLVVLMVCLYLWLGQDDRRQAGRGDSDGRRFPGRGIRLPAPTAEARAVWR